MAEGGSNEQDKILIATKSVQQSSSLNNNEKEQNNETRGKHRLNDFYKFRKTHNSNVYRQKHEGTIMLS